MCGFIILSTGITGLYIGKVFEQSRGRPIYVVDRVVEREQLESPAGAMTARRLGGALDGAGRLADSAAC